MIIIIKPTRYDESFLRQSAKPEVNLKILQVNSKNEYLCFWLDRIAFMQNVFNAFDCMNLNRKNEVKVNDRITIQNTDKYQLTYLRCDQVAQFTERLMKCDSLMKQNAVCNQFLFKGEFFLKIGSIAIPKGLLCLIFSDNTENGLFSDHNIRLHTTYLSLYQNYMLLP